MKILNWKNILWLSLVSYALYALLWLMLGDNGVDVQDDMSLINVMAFDFCICVLFIGVSLFYSRTLFRLLPMRGKPYARLLFYAFILFLLNNAMAYLMTLGFDMIWNDGDNPLFRMQGIYTYAMIATFVSSIYSNAYYLETSLNAENQKRTLEVALLKEKEIALQSQLDALKSQIDAHFMFNNFSILSELIEEDQKLAGKFLANLSKVYRYIIQNMKRHEIPIGEEISFLDAYLYLIEMRYGKTVIVNIDNDVRLADGNIPPACLQLLVENAIKYNRHSVEQPLCIDIHREDDSISVANKIAPLLSVAEPSTGIGHKNIAERYSLLGNRRMTICKTADEYIVKLPILKSCLNAKCTDTRR